MVFPVVMYGCESWTVKKAERRRNDAWLPFETRPDSPGEPGMQPRDPCLPWRGILGPGKNRESYILNCLHFFLPLLENITEF